MKVKEIMNRFVVMALPDETLRQVAKKMEMYNVGFIVIIDEDKRPIGVVTDRDMVIRGVAYGVTPDAPVRNVMTQDVIAVTEDVELVEALRTMEENAIRRLPVIDYEGTVVGLLTSDEVLVRLVGQLNKLGTVYAQSLRPSGF